MEVHEVHPSQRRVSCEHCRTQKAKCQRVQPDDAKCLRCTLKDLVCGSGQQRKPGRPKRGDFDSSSTGRRKSPVKKRRKQSHVLSILGTPDSGWSEWPIVMTDRWCRKMFPGSVRAEPSKDSDTNTLQNGNATTPGVACRDDAAHDRVAYDTGPISLAPMDQALYRGSLAWVSPGFQVSPRLPSTDGLTGRKVPPPFGVGRPPTHYVHENRFSSAATDVATRHGARNGASTMAGLYRTLCGLRLRRAMVHANKSKMSLNLMIHREGPFFIANYSLCEYVMTATQELVQIATWITCGPQSTCKHDEQLSKCLIPTMMDIYCLILSFFQLFLEHLVAGAERQGENPVIPIPGLTFNGVVLTGPCTQGSLFSSSSFYLLARLENVLGLDPVCRHAGLLSAHQIDALCDRLDRSDDLSKTKGIMRPADLRSLYARVATVMEQLSVNE